MNYEDVINYLFMPLLIVLGAANTYLVLTTLKKQQRPKHGKAVILDTCALIDGRIVDVARAGFVSRELLIPSSVVRELQYLADQADALKRERARYGLDVINQLQELNTVDVTILSDNKHHSTSVDDQLIKLAKQYGARLYTTDFNLGKVALVEGVTVLNINELAQALRPRLLPGERASIKLVQGGQNADQAVGYLDDGTMVVVEHGRYQINNTVEVTFTRMLQTEAGKMMFATLVNHAQPKKHSQNEPKQAAPKRRRFVRKPQ